MDENFCQYFGLSQFYLWWQNRKIWKKSIIAARKSFELLIRILKWSKSKQFIKFNGFVYLNLKFKQELF